MVDHILDRIREADPVEVHVVTNSKFAGAFSEWAPPGVIVHDDGTTSEHDRLGAIGDLRFVLERVGIDDDWLVVAGDNLFDYSLRDYVDWWRSKGVASAVALYEHPDRELVKQYGVVELDEQERVVSFVEKPAEPPSNLAATACYLFHREHLKLVATYLEEGNVARPARALRRVAPSARAGVRLPLQPASGWTSATATSSSRRTTARGPAQASPREPSTPRAERRQSAPPPSNWVGSLPAAHGGDATAGTRPRPSRDRVASCPWRDDRSTAARSRAAPAVRSTRGHGPPRPAPPATLRRVRAPRRAGLQRLPRRVAAASRPPLRAVLRADGLAGPPLSRVRGAAPGLRARPLGGGLRRSGQPSGPRLEGARPPSPRRGRGRGDRRRARAPGRAARLRPARSGASPRARLSPRRGAGARARRALGRPRPRGPRPCAPRSTPTRTHRSPSAGRTCAERSWPLARHPPSCWSTTSTRRARRPTPRLPRSDGQARAASRS